MMGMEHQTIEPALLELMPNAKRDSIEQTYRHRVSSVRLFDNVIASVSIEQPGETVAQFLETKEALVTADLRYHQECLAGLAEISPGTAAQSNLDLPKQRRKWLEALRPLVMEHAALQGSKRSISADFSEQLHVDKKRKSTSKKESNDKGNEAYHEILEKAYAKIISSFNTKIVVHMKQPKFRQDKFRAASIEYYGAKKMDVNGVTRIFCSVFGWRDRDEVTAAHIVPKCFSDTTLQHLFGSNEAYARTSTRNSLILSNKVERALDTGMIAIVPIARESEAPTRWKIILLQPEIRKDMAVSWGNSYKKWADIEDKELQFFNENRPAARFLYFRFILSLMQAVHAGRTDIVHELGLDTDEHVVAFWPSPGEYLRRSTLRSLMRNISGLQLPSALIEMTTFDDKGMADDDLSVKSLQCDIDVADGLLQIREEAKRKLDVALYGSDYEDSSENDALTDN